MPNPKDYHLLFPEAAAETAAAKPDREDEGRLAVDVSESTDAITVRAPIAGVSPENLEVFAHDGMLTVRGTRHAEAQAADGESYLVRECHWGAFSRSVMLPPDVDTDAIAAHLKDGVLTVTLPKRGRRAKKDPR